MLSLNSAMGWTAERSEFESLLGQELSILHVVQVGSGAHPAAFTMGTRRSFSEYKAAGA
jgi:hypothetical protein